MLSEMSIKLQPLPRIVFGAGSTGEMGKHLRGTGKNRVFVVTDAGLVEAGLVQPIADGLESDGYEVTIFDGVESNPTDANVRAGVEKLNDFGDAAVLAIGGGSSMDAGKAIALLVNNAGHPRDFGYGCKPEKPGQPVVAIPTTAGTGSETNLVGVITDTENDRKIYVAHPSVQPKVAVLDPELTLGLPPYPTATCGFDVLTHAIEAYTSRVANPYADGVALQAIRMAWRHLPQAYEDGSNLEARSQMLLASAMAAIAFNVAGLGACHGTGHPIGARFHAAHGQCLATMLPHVMRFNCEAREEKYAEIAEAMGVAQPGSSQGENARAGIDAVHLLIERLGLDKSLGELGASGDDIGKLVEDALQDITMRTNARKVTAEDVTNLFESAMA